MRRLFNSNSGETLVEMVVALALLALTVTMVVTVFTATSDSLALNIDTKRDISKQTEDLLLEENVSVVGTYTISWVNGTSTETVNVELIKSDDGGLAKYRNQ